jgi:alpha/beta superfamily hydrolase
MLKEERIYFPSGELKLEGLYADAGSESGVVICHPNPLMGGSMQNNVVESLVSAFNEKGYSTLRFNFRGVGRSEGTHDQGAGEGDDLASAVSFLQSRGTKIISLAGYSFGAWVTANYLQGGSPVDQVVLIAPPVSVYCFQTETIAGKVSLIVCGEKDPFCKAEDMVSFSREVQSKAVFISKTDHFFAGKEEDLIKTVRENLA